MAVDLRATTVAVEGHGGDLIEAYLGEPLGTEHVGAVVVIHHLPGYDEATKEFVRKFAANGYLAICPNLYSREAPGASSDDAAALVRARGGVPDERLVGDVAGAAAFLRQRPNSSSCSGEGNLSSAPKSPSNGHERFPSNGVSAVNENGESEGGSTTTKAP